MRIIALMNQKGGVGKTTTTANLGAALAEAGKRVCLIDLDPQAHLTINYGVEPTREGVSLYDVLVEERGFLEAIQRLDKNIALVPGSIDLAAAEIELVSVLGREMLLKKRIEASNTAAEFDYMLLDCPPSLGLLTINALALAGEVIIPMQPHFLALQGVAKLLETVQLVNRRMNPKLKVGGIVLTMYDSQTKLSNEVVAELTRFIEQARAAALSGKPLPWSDAVIFQSKIRRNIKLAECPSFGKTILQYEPTSNGAADYRALAGEVIAMDEVKVVAGPTGAQTPAATQTAARADQTPNAQTPAAIPAATPAAAQTATPAATTRAIETPAVPETIVPRALTNPDVDPSKLAAATVGADVVKKSARSKKAADKSASGSEVAA